MSKIRPDALVVFTLAPELQGLEIERKTIRNVFLDHGGNADVDFGFSLDFFKIIQEQKAETLMFFHYAGHASAEGIEHLVKNEKGEETVEILPYSDLANYLENSFKNLKLVFINGCNSEDAARFFLRKADALICTNSPIGDKKAATFARNFYSNFLKINDLATAFVSTEGLIALGGARGSNMSNEPARVAMSSSILRKSTGADPSVYELKFRADNPEIGKSTFASWCKLIQSDDKQVKETPATSKNLGIPTHAYLRCNREDQVFDFEEKLTEKIDNKTPQPLFVFIHGLEKHCPSDLFDRFINYTLADEKWQLNRTPTELALPKNPDLRNLNKCKLLLMNSYCNAGGFGQQLAKDTWQLTQQMPDNEWIVIRHELTYGEWQPNWEVFFDYYINEFGEELAKKMSKKILIITTRDTESENDEFAEYFEKLANDPTKQVVNLTGFKKIKPIHIMTWQKEVFKNQSYTFTSDEIVPPNEEKFFFDIKELLKAKLA